MKSLVMSDHHRTSEQLRDASEQLRDASAALVAGGAIPFDEAELARIEATVTRVRRVAWIMCGILAVIAALMTPSAAHPANWGGDKRPTG